MITKGFPDLLWLKGQIAQKFRDRRGPGNLQLDSEGFPSVVINAKSASAYRPDVMGPISLFLNVKGSSRCKVDGKTAVVDEDTYFISNRFQPYTLEIENRDTTETFNIHIGEYFSEQLLASLMNTSDTLLNQGKQLDVPTVAFHNKLYPRDAVFNRLVQNLQGAYCDGQTDKLLFDEKLADILLYLLQQHRNMVKEIAGMPSLKRSTQLELYKRLALAADYMHASYMGRVELDEIAGAACLSKFHFLRLFKHLYHVSPYQYLQNLRMEKAGKLLAGSSESVSEIALMMGYENSNSFSRLFRQHKGIYPTQYRSCKIA